VPTNLRRRAAEHFYRLRSHPPLLTRSRAPAPPDFVGIGAQRAGTSWWHALIESHPQVHSLGWPFKELHFFDCFDADAFSDEDVAAYHDWFRKPQGRVAGEWTPRYMFDAHTPALLRRAAPDTRLLVLLRDPIRRFRSGFTHALARGVRREIAWEEATRRGFYHAQLANVLASFPREQLLVLQFEQCVAQPAAMLARTFAFLDLAPHHPPHIDATVNRGVEPQPLSEADNALLRDAYRDDVAALVSAFPEIDRALWPTVSAP
jgi:hypothetical protein